MGHDRATLTLLERIAGASRGESSPGWQLDVLAGLLDGLEQRGSSLAHDAQGRRQGRAGGNRTALAGLFAFAQDRGR